MSTPLSIGAGSHPNGAGRFATSSAGSTGARRRFDFVRKRRWWFTDLGDHHPRRRWSRSAPAGLNLQHRLRRRDRPGRCSPRTCHRRPGEDRRQPRSASAGHTIESAGRSRQRAAAIRVEAKIGSRPDAPERRPDDHDRPGRPRQAGQRQRQRRQHRAGRPSWGGQITHKAIEALIVFFIMIAAYISIFFEWKMALAAIVAVIHDILVTVGIYSLTGFSVTPDTVVAVPHDPRLLALRHDRRVRPRTRQHQAVSARPARLTYTDVVNLSMNQTLARSINTSLVAILPILSVLVLGAQILGAVDPPVLRPGAVHRPHERGLLVDLHRLAALGGVQGAASSRYRSIRDKLEARAVRACCCSRRLP